MCALLRSATRRTIRARPAQMTPLLQLMRWMTLRSPGPSPPPAMTRRIALRAVASAAIRCRRRVVCPSATRALLRTSAFPHPPRIQCRMDSTGDEPCVCNTRNGKRGARVAVSTHQHTHGPASKAPTPPLPPLSRSHVDCCGLRAACVIICFSLLPPQLRDCSCLRSASGVRRAVSVVRRIWAQS